MAYKRIGIIGGVGPAATILYYQLLLEGCRKRTGGESVPEIVIYSLDITQIDGYFKKNNLDGLSDKLINVVQGFEQQACDLALFSCNAMHLAYDRVAERVHIPMINMIDAVVEEAIRQRLKCVGIMGTIFVMQSGLYSDILGKKGITTVLPEPDQQEWIMDAIHVDLQKPVIPEATTKRLLNIAQMLVDQGAEAVILGCTDLPAGINKHNCPVPVLDTTEIHVNAILDRALGK